MQKHNNAARSLGIGFKNSLKCAIPDRYNWRNRRRDVHIHVHTGIHLEIFTVPHMMFTQSLLRDVSSLVCFASGCDCFSWPRLPSRLEADATSTPAAAAAAAAPAAVVGLDFTKGSTLPKPSVVEADSSVVLTVPHPVSLSPLSRYYACSLCSVRR